MKFYMSDKINRLVEIKELKITEPIRNKEHYLNSGIQFLKKYTDLNDDEVKIILEISDGLESIIDIFIQINNLDDKNMFIKTLNEFYASVGDSLLGFCYFTLINKGYKVKDLMNNTSKELFWIFLTEIKSNPINFVDQEKFNSFKTFLQEIIGEENVESFLRFTKPLIDSRPYNTSQEEIFKENLKELQEL